VAGCRENTVGSAGTWDFILKAICVHYGEPGKHRGLAGRQSKSDATQ